MFYQKQNDKIKCLLCNHYCILKEQQIGICGVNKNVGDKIDCLVYGYPSVIHLDPIEKKPLYHFLPNTTTLSLGSVGCNFKCPFCQNHSLSQNKFIQKKQYYSPKQIVQLALEHGCNSISYTYNEPTIFFPYIYDIATLAKSYGLKNTMVTNGYQSIEVVKKMKGLIDGVNIDLKSFNTNYYKKALGGDIEFVKRNLIDMKKSGIWVEVTTLVIPNRNDSDQELKDIADFIANNLGVDTPWHLSAFHPDYKEKNLPNTSIQTLQKAYDIGKKAKLKYIYLGNINNLNTTKCNLCNQDVIVRKGFNILKNELKQHISQCKNKIDGVFDMVRLPKVANSFYPSSKEQLISYFTHFNNILNQHNISSSFPKARAIISPHAGYIYSGFSANLAYVSVAKNSYKRVVVIGPSHQFGFEGASIFMGERYWTPFGDIKVDEEESLKLKEKFDFLTFLPKAHFEHSTETQAPFIKYYLPTTNIVEIVYSKISDISLSKLIQYLLKDEQTLVVISTDLSHFYNLLEANRLDKICIDSIKNLDISIWDRGCEACGRVGVRGLIHASKKLNLTPYILDYRTSYDQSKDKNRVVGYLSAIFIYTFP